jgi:hypothetical protein
MLAKTKDVHAVLTVRCVAFRSETRLVLYGQYRRRRLSQQKGGSVGGGGIEEFLNDRCAVAFFRFGGNLLVNE